MKETPHKQWNPYELNRKQLRLQNHDYGCTETFFVTVCVKDRKHYFGEVVDGEMIPSRQGCVANVIFRMMPKFYSNIEMQEFIVMPDHVHLLLFISNDEGDQRAFEQRDDWDVSVSVKDKKKTLSTIIGALKSAITRECRRLGLEMEWQSSYYDHIVRNYEEHIRILHYIQSNPMNWEVEQNSNGIWI